jgi:hypothetical protein
MPSRDGSRPAKPVAPHAAMDGACREIQESPEKRPAARVTRERLREL